MDYRSYPTGGDRRRVVDDADQAYACLFSSGCFPKKLSIVMPDDAIMCIACSCTTDDEEDTAGIQEDGVEDPRLEWLNNGGLPLCTLPFAVLRVLELTGYDLKPYYSDGPRQLAFPCLQAMRLRRCRTESTTLQKIIAAAPRLADIRLESLDFVDNEYEYRLSCEAATVMVMENCGMQHHYRHFGGCSIRLDAPRLRYLRYAHNMVYDDLTSFSFLYHSRPQQLEQVHLEVHPTAACLWRSILSEVSHARSLKLTAYSIADLNSIESAPLLQNIEVLEIEDLCGWSVLDHGAMSKAMVNLLRRCPCLGELRVKFSWRKYLREINIDPADEMAAIADFSPCRSVDDDDSEDEAVCCQSCDSLEDLHGQFCCDHTVGCLRRVVVEFDAEELTCFQVRLVRFLAKGAVDLQELVIDGGKGYDSSRIDRKVARWRKRRRPSQPPSWPPLLSEFPPLEAPPTLPDKHFDDDLDEDVSQEDKSLKHYVHSFEDDDSDDDEEDISPRHYMHSGRKKKKGGSGECFSVKPKTKGLITSGWTKAGAIRCRRRHRRSDWENEEGDTSTGFPLATTSPPSVPAPSHAEPWTAPLLYEFPMLRRAPPAPLKPLSPPDSPSLNHATPIPSCLGNSCAREWRAVRIDDLDMDLAISSRHSHRMRLRQRPPPAASHGRLGPFRGPFRTRCRR